MLGHTVVVYIEMKAIQKYPIRYTIHIYTHTRGDQTLHIVWVSRTIVHSHFIKHVRCNWSIKKITGVQYAHYDRRQSRQKERKREKEGKRNKPSRSLFFLGKTARMLWLEFIFRLFCKLWTIQAFQNTLNTLLTL